MYGNSLYREVSNGGPKRRLGVVVHPTVTGGTTQALTMWGQFVEEKKIPIHTSWPSRSRFKKKKKRPQPLTNVMRK